MLGLQVGTKARFPTDSFVVVFSERLSCELVIPPIQPYECCLVLIKMGTALQQSHGLLSIAHSGVTLFGRLQNLYKVKGVC